MNSYYVIWGDKRLLTQEANLLDLHKTVQAQFGPACALGDYSVRVLEPPKYATNGHSKTSKQPTRYQQSPTNEKRAK